MIGKIRYPDGRTYTCDDCRNDAAKFTNTKRAQSAGWAVAKGRKNCYCPKCAPKHRHTGCKGAPLPPARQPDWLPAGYIQTEIDLNAE